MCQHVCVSGTQHVSVRMPAELVAAIDQRAARENRSRGQVVVLVLGSAFGVNPGVRLKHARSEAARTTIAIRPTAGSSAEGAER
jgi:hypothetical protein